MKYTLIIATLAACVTIGAGCKTTQLLGFGGAEKQIASMAEQEIARAAAKEGVSVSKSQIKAFVAYVSSSTALDQMAADLVRQNANHAAVRSLAADWATRIGTPVPGPSSPPVAAPYAGQ